MEPGFDATLTLPTEEHKAALAWLPQPLDKPEQPQREVFCSVHAQSRYCRKLILMLNQEKDKRLSFNYVSDPDAAGKPRIAALVFQHP